MDVLIAAAARALAAGDSLAALKRVALRNDAPALALRGIAMAQLGDLVRAKALLRKAARAFGPKHAVAQARCILAEAEIALVSRDLSSPAKGPDVALDKARATLERHGDRTNAAHTRHLEVRRLLLIGRLDEADRALAKLDAAPLPPALRAAHELAVAGVAMRRLRVKVARAALAEAGRAARDTGIPALMAEVESTVGVLDTPAARLIAPGADGPSSSRRSKRCSLRGRLSSTLAAKPCATPTPRSRSPHGRSCSRSFAHWAKRGPRMFRGARCSLAPFGRSTRTNRIARDCASKSGGFAPSSNPLRT
jgi:tetratricopeptide (TPR) repeat protein